MKNNNPYLLDSSVFISKYIQEEDCDTCERIINDCGNGYIGYVSIISLGEVLKKIIKHIEDKTAKLTALDSFLLDLENFKIIGIDENVMKISNMLKEDVWTDGYQDSLILSCGIKEKCTVFITKDKNIVAALGKIRDFSYKVNGIRMKCILTENISKHNKKHNKN